MLTETRAVTTEDIVYLRHGARAMEMRLFRPDGAGPFPVVVDLHGGGWCKNDHTACFARDEMLAEAGIAAAALDFRHAGDGYLASMADINYAVRWLKSQAGALGLDAGRVALCGQSSGGHLAMLAAMRPNDPRYAAIPLAGGGAADASVRCVAMQWPVINPLSRYRHALRARAEGGNAGWVGDLPERHELYWRTEDIMAEGNPVLALERGEPVETPPAIWVQGQPDIVHDYRDPDSPLDLNEPERFVADYRKAGGKIELVHFDKADRDGPVPVEPLIPFFGKHL